MELDSVRSVHVVVAVAVGLAAVGGVAVVWCRRARSGAEPQSTSRTIRAALGASGASTYTIGSTPTAPV